MILESGGVSLKIEHNSSGENKMCKPETWTAGWAGTREMWS